VFFSRERSTRAQIRLCRQTGGVVPRQITSPSPLPSQGREQGEGLVGSIKGIRSRNPSPPILSPVRGETVNAAHFLVPNPRSHETDVI
jgi:hypothetical protein